MSTAIRHDESWTVLLEAWMEEERLIQDEIGRGLERLSQHVIDADPEALQRHLLGLEPLLARMEALAAKRTKTVAHLARVLGLSADAVDLDALVAMASDARRPQLATARARLRHAAAEVRRLNGRANMLLRAAMSLDRELVRGVFAAEAPSVTYRPDGATEEKSRRPILDRSF